MSTSASSRSSERPRVRRRRVAASTAIVVASVLLRAPPTSAFGYKDTGFDADDVPVDRTSCCQQDPDVRTTTRKVWTSDGRAWLTITVRTFESFVGYWTLRVPLDARGGPRADYRMEMFDDGEGGTGCRVRRRMSPRWQDGAFFSAFEARATCRVPLRFVTSNKRIRWKLYGKGGGEGTGPAVDEYAPSNRGWYS